MYLPSMLFGGSSFIHLLASHPRVVALVGISALATSLLQSPFGIPNVGATGQVVRLEQSPNAQGTALGTSVERASQSAKSNAKGASPARLAAIIGQTLKDCGRGCADVSRDAVLSNPALLNDVLMLHALEQAHVDHVSARGNASRNATVAP